MRAILSRLSRGLRHRLALRDGVARLLHRPGLHERRIAGLFTGRHAFAGPAPLSPVPLLLVAFTNRSGSHLLCDYLAQTGRLSAGGEFLNHPVVERLHQRLGAEDFPGYLAALTREHCRAGQQLVLKASAEQLAMLLRWNIPAMFPATRILHLRREDALAQAVSLLVASRTGRWTAPQPAVAQPMGPQPGPQGSLPPLQADPMPQVERIMARQRLENQAIAVAAGLSGLPRMALSYEELLADPAGRVAAVLAFCRIASPQPPALHPPRVERQTEADKSALLAALRGRLAAGLAPGPTG